MEIKIRKAVESDLPAIMEVIAQAQEALRERGVDQWQDGYPDEEAILDDIRQECCYVAAEAGEPLRDGGEGPGCRILGMAAILLDGEPDYDVIVEGEWLGDGPYITVHRVAVGSRAVRKGIASRLLEEAERIAGEKGLAAVRMDTHRDNKVMQMCMERNGLKKCGVIRLGRDGAERLAYEKRLA